MSTALAARNSAVATRNVDLNNLFCTYIHTYLRRQQERGLMQKARRLMDENVPNSLVFYYTWFRKPNSRVQRRSEQYLEACFALFLCTGGACAEAKIFQ